MRAAQASTFQCNSLPFLLLYYFQCTPVHPVYAHSYVTFFRFNPHRLVCMCVTIVLIRDALPLFFSENPTEEMHRCTPSRSYGYVIDHDARYTPYFIFGGKSMQAARHKPSTPSLAVLDTAVRRRHAKKTRISRVHRAYCARLYASAVYGVFPKC